MRQEPNNSVYLASYWLGYEYHFNNQFLCSNCGEDHASGQFSNCSAKLEIESSCAVLSEVSNSISISTILESKANVNRHLNFLVYNFSCQGGNPGRALAANRTSNPCLNVGNLGEFREFYRSRSCSSQYAIMTPIAILAGINNKTRKCNIFLSLSLPSSLI